MNTMKLTVMASAAALMALTGCNAPMASSQAKKAGADQYKLLMDYAAQKRFGNPLPHVKLDDFVYRSYTRADRDLIKAEIDRQFAAGKVVVLEKWVDWKVEDISSRVDALVQSALADAETNGYSQCSGKFEQAREIAWQDCVGAELEGEALADVDEKVRKATIEFMVTKVNPRHWPIIEREMRFMANSYCVDSKFEEGILAIRNYPLIRVYTSVLDARLDAVTAELVRLGIPEAGLRPLSEIARKAMSVAANIVVNCDVVATEEKENRLDAGNNPDTAKYRELLKEYHDALILYNCTKENADKITKTLAESVEGLVAKLRRDPKFGKEFLKHIKRLSATAINKRILALREEMLALIEKNRKIRDAALAPIRELQAKNDMKAAQELAVKALLKLDPKSEEAKFLRPFLINYITTKVNPELWAAMEKEISAKVEAFVRDGKAVEGVAWLFNYPFVRTYAEEIDQRYADVKAEAVALGVPKEIATRFIDEIMVMTAPMDRLANFDDFYFERVTPGTPLTDKQLAKYEKALSACRKALVDNDCTDENADKLIQEIRNRFAPEFAKIGGEKREQILVLGACAINKRLVALKERSMAGMIARCAGDFAKKGKFAEARAVVRDVALTGCSDFDTKAFGVRIGVLNSIVNPLQLVSELAAIDKKSQAFIDAGDYRGLLAWSKAYPGVHDSYADVEKSVAAIRNAAVGLKIDAVDADKYAEKLTTRLRTLLEKRAGEYIPPEAQPDYAELLKAAGQLEEAVLAQYFDRKFTDRLRGAIPEEVKKLLLKARPETLTTWALNENLRTRIDAIIAAFDIKEMIARQEYLELLAAMDGEYSYDSQIAMAEDAIAKQLGVKCPKSHLRANAILGEYARAMRLLKLKEKLTADQLTALVVGSVYLDQATVFNRAKELGANVNAVTPRDPLGRTPLLFAIQLGRVAFVHRLVAAGAKVDVKDVQGSTSVHYAVRRGNLAVLKAMIAKNDVNAANAEGDTALFDAARQNQPALVEALTAAKADVAIANKAGKTAFDVACECGSRDVLDAFAEAGAAYGPKQLAIAAANDQLGVAQWLVTHGVDVNGAGVMAGAKCGTDTKRYLIREGGVPSDCNCEICKPVKVVVKEAGKTAEASGTLNFSIKEAK